MLHHSIRLSFAISIHTPLAGSDRQREHTDRCGEISIHTPLAGSDACRIDIGRFRRDFNPHSPCGERRAGRCRVRCFRCYFNPHSPCGERLPRLNIISPLYPISIHTPLAGSDGMHQRTGENHQISIHTPLAGSDFGGHSRTAVRNGFQSTLPLRGATSAARHFRRADGISIHTPLAGSDHAPAERAEDSTYFNPHSPCGERRMLSSSVWPNDAFQSTLPLRGATWPYRMSPL